MELLQFYFPELSEKQIEQFTALKPLYAFWNAQINVISRKDFEHFYERHVLHALGIAKIHAFTDKSKVLDVGTGGGFPGIPLAILFPNTHFTLVDSIGKKIKVVQAVADELGLENVHAQTSRAEDVDGSFDFIVSRAVTRMPEFLQWVESKLNKKSMQPFKNGVLYLKGGDLSDELADLKGYIKSYALNDYFKEDFFETKKVIYWFK